MRAWELWCCGAAALGVIVAAILRDTHVLMCFAVLCGLFAGIWCGKQIYASEEVLNPGAYRTLTEKELAERRRQER